MREQKILSRVMFNKELVPAEETSEESEESYGKWRGLAFHYIFTEIFWRHNEQKILGWKRKLDYDDFSFVDANPFEG